MPRLVHYWAAGSGGRHRRGLPVCRLRGQLREFAREDPGGLTFGRESGSNIFSKLTTTSMSIHATSRNAFRWGMTLRSPERRLFGYCQRLAFRQDGGRGEILRGKILWSLGFRRRLLVEPSRLRMAREERTEWIRQVRSIRGQNGWGLDQRIRFGREARARITTSDHRAVRSISSGTRPTHERREHRTETGGIRPKYRTSSRELR